MAEEVMKSVMFPTPSATDHKGGGREGNAAERGATKSNVYAEQQTGRLNPVFVEFLMAWPLGFTETHAIMGQAKQPGDNDAKNCDRPSPTLPTLQQTDEQEAIQRQGGGHGGIQAPEVLRQDVHGEGHDSGGGDAGRTQGAGGEISRGDVRGMRSGGAATDTPQRQQPREQFTRELNDALHCLPREMALGAREATSSAKSEMQGRELPDTCEALRILPDPCDQGQEVRRPDGKEDQDKSRMGIGWWEIEPDIGRVTDISKDRANRLKALGNGQVPLQAATAFSILMNLTMC
ncbi:MAG: hypothetical protein ACYC36_03580 [Bellilinea sp.]